jgi:hypothetical protein
VSAQDAEPVSQASPSDARGSSWVAPGQVQGSASVGSEGIRCGGLRQGFAQGLTEEVAAIIRQYRLPDLDTHLVDCLIFNWHLMKASEWLLEVALDHPLVRPDLYRYYAQHLLEERGHLMWLFEDLGGTAQSDWNPNVTPVSAATLAGMIMYAVEFIDPVCLLGYMLVMESFPLSADKLDQLEAIYGQHLLRTARYHAEHDKEHARDLRDMIDTLSLPRQRLVRWTATAAATLLGGALEDIAHEA